MFESTFYRELASNETEFREARGAHFKYPKCIVGTTSNPVCNMMQSTISRAIEIGTEVP